MSLSLSTLLYLEDKEGNRTPFDSILAGTRKPMPMVALSMAAAPVLPRLSPRAARQWFGHFSRYYHLWQGSGAILYPLRDGSALTEQGYLTSGGKDINGVGIEPDIVVEVTLEEEEAIYLDEAKIDPQLEKALEVLRTQLET